MTTRRHDALPHPPLSMSSSRPRCSYKHWIKGSPSKATKALDRWMKKTNTNLAMLARRVDCTWFRMRAIATGTSAPDVVQALRLVDIAGVPVVWWREAAR